MAKVFEQVGLGALQPANRLVRSATWEGMCSADGRPTKKLVDYYTELARGGVGLIVSGYAYVSPEGKQMPGKMGMHDDALAKDHIRLTQAVHEAGGLVVVQLVHAGGQTDSDKAGQRPVAPSALELEQYPELPQELSKERISELISAFAKAAARAKAWGYDGVQLHAAHGYLLNQFLSPLTNQRMDEYGGPLPHRCRFLLDAYQAVRVAVGGAYPVMAKLTAGDNLDGGLVLNEAVYAGRELSAAGINALEISSGTPVSGKLTPARKKILKPEQEAYNLDVAGIIKSEVACPVMVVGGFRSLAKVRHAVEDKGIDFVSLSRPLIREPDLPKRWQEGDESPAKCISCNACFIPGIKEGGIYCMQEKKEQERAAKGEE